MRTLVLEDHSNNITLSHTHFIYVATGDDSEDPILVTARDVEAGRHRLFVFDVVSNHTATKMVSHVEAHVMRQKRVFFTASPYVLVNNIIASPYMGAHPDVAAWQHLVFATVNSFTGGGVVSQAFVTVWSVPFLIVNHAMQLFFF